MGHGEGTEDPGTGWHPARGTADSIGGADDMPNASDWSRALDAQLELISWWRSDAGLAWATYLRNRDDLGEEEAVQLLNFTAACLQAGKSDAFNHKKLVDEWPERSERIKAGFDVAYDFANVLDESATYWVSEEMSRFVFHAHRDIPTHPLSITDLPNPKGFVYFADPLVFESADTGKPLPTRVVEWNLHQKSETTIDIATYRDHPTRRGLSLAQLAMWREGEAAPGTLAKILQAFWILSAQRIARAETRPVERHSRRRAERSGFTIPEDGIQVVTLRRPETKSSRGAAGMVDWSYRWIVSGHWRDQWYPSEMDHKPVWIDAYEKGPDDKPLVIKDRVYRWVR